MGAAFIRGAQRDVIASAKQIREKHVFSDLDTSRPRIEIALRRDYR